MAKRDVDACIEAMASQVHSPKGKMADHDQVYAELQKRMERDESRSMIRPAHSVGFMRRISVAASIALGGCFIAFAITYLYKGPIQRWLNEPEPQRQESSAPTAVEEFVFEEEALSRIVSQLSVIYRTEITITSSELEDYQVTATFTSDEPIEDILSALATVASCHWKKTESGYALY